MAFTATWGPKGFLVSPKKIVPLTGLATSFALKSESNNDTSGTPTLNTKGMELQTITLETTYMAAVGVDPRSQIAGWRDLVGAVYPLYIGGQRFGPAKLQLQKVDVSNVQLNNAGRFISATVGITLTEYVPPTTKASSKKTVAKTGTGTTTKDTTTKATSKATATTKNKAAAVAAAPTTDDKASKKYTPARSGGAK